MKEKDINEIISKHGYKAQSMIAMEECAELIQAISKCIRTKEFPAIEEREHLIEEMADVMFCMDQLQVMYQITDEELYAMKQYKEKRTLKRLKDESN